LHLGLARTALLGWLRARAQNGVFVVRIEDIDRPRVVPGSADRILRDLRWLGLDWDEGPEVGGPYGPYVQSDKLERYREVVSMLDARCALYPCTCSRKEIATMASAPHQGDEGPIYPGTCRDGASHPGRAASLRLRMPEPPPSFVDLFCGPSPPGLGRGDFVVSRKDGIFAYQLVCVVDDHDQHITEVLRGDDLLSSTPRQLALYDALDWPRPSFLHVPLVFGPDGRRLAKRDGALPVDGLRQAGVTPERILGRLAQSAGLVPTDAPISARDLVAHFSLSALDHAPARLNPVFDGSL
jgi:glutamyl-tRNA synthetase